MGIETVWNFVTNPKNFSKYVYGYDDGSVISSYNIGLGAKYEWYGKIGPLKLKSIEEIVKWEKNKRVAYKGKLCGIPFDSSMNVTKMKNGQTQLTVSISYKAPLFLGGKIIDILLIQQIVKSHIHHSLHQLRTIKNNKELGMIISR